MRSRIHRALISWLKPKSKVALDGMVASMSSAAAGWRFTTGTIGFTSSGFRTRAVLHAITPIGVELGLWQGSYQNPAILWLRWWDTEGNLLLTGAERASRTQQTLLDAIPRLLGMGLNAEQVG